MDAHYEGRREILDTRGESAMNREQRERGEALERKLQRNPELLTEEELELLKDFIEEDIRRIKRQQIREGILAALIVLFGGGNLIVLLVRALL